MEKILIVYHSQSGNTKAAAENVAEGAKQARAKVTVKEALRATVKDLLSCDAIAVGTPDYFSYMAGGLKDFFDRTYYPTQGSVTDKPCGIFVTHGGGGKAVESVKNICATFKFKVIGKPVLIKDRPDKEAITQLVNLGKLLTQTAKQQK